VGPAVGNGFSGRTLVVKKQLLLRFTHSMSPRMFLAIDILHRLPPKDRRGGNCGLRLFGFFDGSCYRKRTGLPLEPRGLSLSMLRCSVRHFYAMGSKCVAQTRDLETSCLVQGKHDLEWL
jgi:hypothetical protein